MSADSDPICRVEGSGKLRNGLYLRGIALYRDHVAFEVFASRPLDVGELGLELNDRTATEYELVLPASGVIDGKTSIDFQPAPPPGAVALHLRAPGWGLTLGAVALPNS